MCLYLLYLFTSLFIYIEIAVHKYGLQLQSSSVYSGDTKKIIIIENDFSNNVFFSCSFSWNFLLEMEQFTFYSTYQRSSWFNFLVRNYRRNLFGRRRSVIYVFFQVKLYNDTISFKLSNVKGSQSPYISSGLVNMDPYIELGCSINQ